MKTLEDLKQAQDIIQMKPKKNARRNNTKTWNIGSQQQLVLAQQQSGLAEQQLVLPC